jgi:hypothetical protein
MNIFKGKKPILYTLLTMVIVLLLLVSLFFVARWTNTYKVYRFEKSLTQMELPGDSQVIESTSRFGLLWGNSNHCDVEVIAMVESDLSFEEFEDGFDSQQSQLSVPYPNAIKETPTHISLYAYADGQATYRNFEENIVEVNDTEYGLGSRANRFLLDFAKSVETDSSNNYYLIKATDQTFDGFPMYDFRCG